MVVGEIRPGRKLEAAAQVEGVEVAAAGDFRVRLVAAADIDRVRQQCAYHAPFFGHTEHCLRTQQPLVSTRPVIRGGGDGSNQAR